MRHCSRNLLRHDIGNVALLDFEKVDCPRLVDPELNDQFSACCLGQSEAGKIEEADRSRSFVKCRRRQVVPKVRPYRGLGYRIAQAVGRFRWPHVRWGVRVVRLSFSAYDGKSCAQGKVIRIYLGLPKFVGPNKGVCKSYNSGVYSYRECSEEQGVERVGYASRRSKKQKKLLCFIRPCFL